MKPHVARIASAVVRRTAVALLLLASAAAQAQIYAGSEAATGVVVLSNFRSQEAAMLVDGTSPPEPASAAHTPGPAPSEHPGKSRTTSAARPQPELRGIVDRAASRHKLSPALLHAVILAESNYDARAVSPKGAIGLMQLLPTTGQRFGARDLFSVEQNVDAGASYLRWLMAMFDDHLDLVLAAYNAGERAVIDAGCRIPAYPETQAYVKRILDDLARRGASPRRGSDGDAGGCV